LLTNDIDEKAWRGVGGDRVNIRDAREGRALTWVANLDSRASALRRLGGHAAVLSRVRAGLYALRGG
jgi:hypothetical protein